MTDLERALQDALMEATHPCQRLRDHPAEINAQQKREWRL